MAVALLDGLAPGDHICWMVDDDRTRLQSIATWVSAGIHDHHKILYCGDAPAAVIDSVNGIGVDAYEAVAIGQLRADTAEATYLADGAFDPQATLALWAVEAGRARAEGYAGLRVVGDMSWASRRVPGAHLLPQYEIDINTMFTDGFLLGACAYDRRLFDPFDLRRIAWSHAATVNTGNPYDASTALRWRRTAHPCGLRLEGEADLSNREALNAVLRHTLAEFRAGGRTLTVDLAGLRFADTAAARVLVRAAGEGGGLRLTGASPSLSRLLIFNGAAAVPGLLPPEAFAGDENHPRA
jgi:anti-anti-sigma factor